jgi:hypothetical protein
MKKVKCIVNSITRKEVSKQQQRILHTLVQQRGTERRGRVINYPAS